MDRARYLTSGKGRTRALSGGTEPGLQWDDVLVVLTLDAERKVSHQRCAQCGRDYLLVTGFIYQDGDAHAIYYAA
jgi:hypothetical protein